jgi:ribose 5-phosphate isomerase RpiB
MKIVIASDHRGIKRKEEIINHLKKRNIDVEDLGPNTE